MTPTNATANAQPSGSAPAGFEGTVVLSETTRGVAYVPSPTPLTRLNFYDGKFLRASDLTLEQTGQRMLVQLSNQAGGPGIVSGFDATLGSGDVLRVGAGLGIDPRGRVLLLPEPVAVSIATLIQASSQTGLPGPASAPGGAPGFEPCAPATAAPTVQPVQGSQLYLVSIGHVEGLCGTEEVFGRLCDDACVTATDRPYRLEGVAIRVTPLSLTHPLATSKAVALGRGHLRSLVASAYFAGEWDRGGTLLSAAGLAAATWCQGAAAVVGEDLPIAVLSRAGNATVFLDEWTARRERIEAPPRRYWDGLMEMRPWDVFLAQVLQFQCQLREVFSGGGAETPSGPSDPCDDARTLLHESTRIIEELRQQTGTRTQPAGSTRRLAVSEVLRGLGSFKDRAAAVLSAFAPTSGHALIDRGIVELPAAGYLPVDKASATSLPDQVGRLLGDGVDLRFCAVRRDQIAHELERAQHMSRISLLSGLDDPAQRQEVDILVPDGTVETVPTKVPGLGFDVDASLGNTQTDDPAGSPLVITREAFLTAAGTDPGRLPIVGAGRLTMTPSGGLQFFVAASAAPGDRRALLAVMRLLAQIPSQGGPVASRFEHLPDLGHSVPTIRSLQPIALAVHRAAAEMRASDERTRAVSVDLPGGDDPAISLWTTFALDANPFTKAKGDLVGVRASLDAYAPVKPAVAVHHEVIGHLEILDVAETSVLTRVRVRFTSGLDSDHFGLRSIEAAPPAVGTELTLTSSTVAGRREVTVQSHKGSLILRFLASWQGAPVQAKATLSEIVGERTTTAGAEVLLHEDATITRQGNQHHDVAMQGLTMLQGAKLDDPGFLERATHQLFPAEPGAGEARVTAKTDWVLFRRRRFEDCGDQAVPAPAVPSQVATWHILASNAREASAITKALRAGDPVKGPWVRLGSAEFETGTATRRTQAPALEADWLNHGAGNTIFFAGYGANGTGTEAVGRARAQSLVDGVARVAELAPRGDVDVVAHPPSPQLVVSTEGSVFFVTYNREPQVGCADVKLASIFPDIPAGKNFLAGLLNGTFAPVPAEGVQITDLGNVTFTDQDVDPVSLEAVRKKLQEQFPPGPVSLKSVIYVASSFREANPEQGELMAGQITTSLGSTVAKVVTGPVAFDPAECPVRIYLVIEVTIN